MGVDVEYAGAGDLFNHLRDMKLGEVKYLRIVEPKFFGLCGRVKVYLAIRKRTSAWEIANISKSGDWVPFDFSGCRELINGCQLVSEDEALAKSRLKDMLY